MNVKKIVIIKYQYSSIGQYYVRVHYIMCVRGPAGNLVRKRIHVQYMFVYARTLLNYYFVRRLKSCPSNRTQSESIRRRCLTEILRLERNSALVRPEKAGQMFYGRYPRFRPNEISVELHLNIYIYYTRWYGSC